MKDKSAQLANSTAGSQEGSGGARVHRDPPSTFAVDSEHLLRPPADDGSNESFVLPGYVLTSRLGRGAYGEVWHAVRIGAGQDVAVKVFTSPGKLDWRYLQREVDRLLRVAEHPHVVTLLDANLQHQPPFYVMALLRRGSLADLITDGRPFTDVEKAVRWFGQIVNALEFAHGKGLLHCDLKPGNVLLDEEQNARLVDFGQAQLQGDAANVLGTLNYMSPEQAVVARQHETPPDPSVSWDIYSLGATMYALLAGSPPHWHDDFRQTLTSIRGVQGRLAQYRQYVLSTPVRPLRTLNSGVDRDLADIIQHCLLPDPRARYSSISQVADDLRRRCQILPLRARRATAGYRLKKFTRRNLGMIVIAISAIVALCTMLATLTIQHRAERQRLESEIVQLETHLEKAMRDNEKLRQLPNAP